MSKPPALVQSFIQPFIRIGYSLIQKVGQPDVYVRGFGAAAATVRAGFHANLSDNGDAELAIPLVIEPMSGIPRTEPKSDVLIPELNPICPIGYQNPLQQVPAGDLRVYLQADGIFAPTESCPLNIGVVYPDQTEVILDANNITLVGQEYIISLPTFTQFVVVIITRTCN